MSCVSGSQALQVSCEPGVCLGRAGRTEGRGAVSVLQLSVPSLLRDFFNLWGWAGLLQFPATPSDILRGCVNSSYIWSDRGCGPALPLRWKKQAPWKQHNFNCCSIVTAIRAGPLPLVEDALIPVPIVGYDLPFWELLWLLFLVIISLFREFWGSCKYYENGDKWKCQT